MNALVAVAPAPASRRAGALAIDAAVIAFVVTGAQLLIGRRLSPGVDLLAGSLYYGVLQARTGQTLGARLCRLRLVDHRTGLPIGFRRAYRRFSTRTMCALLLLVPVVRAAVTIARDPAWRPLWDRRAGSIMVRIGTTDELARAIVEAHARRAQPPATPVAT